MSPADLRAVRVRLTADEAAYLPASRALATGTYALREVRPGELVPRSALGDRSTRPCSAAAP